jgi:hypothetical protein
VREHLAESNQHVRGIIVAAEIDDALRYAIKGLPDIAVLTYQVDFRLQSVQNTHLE